MSAGKVVWFKSKNNLAEIYQSVNMKFSFANLKGDTFVQCHKWVKCRDFLHDAVRTALTGTKSSIYGFTFEKGVNPDLDLENMTMLISKKNIKKEEDLLPSLQRSIKVINHYEEIAKQPLSKLIKVEEDKECKYKHVWAVTGPKMWMTTPYLVSMYTFLLRIGCKKIEFKENKDITGVLEALTLGKNEKDNDDRYLASIWDKLEPIIEKHNNIIEEGENGYSKLYFEGTPIGAFHDKSGIVSTCKATTWSKEFNGTIKKLLLKESRQHV